MAGMRSTTVGSHSSHEIAYARMKKERRGLLRIAPDAPPACRPLEGVWMMAVAFRSGWPLNRYYI
jgi:hypothetical protein